MLSSKKLNAGCVVLSLALLGACVSTPELNDSEAQPGADQTQVQSYQIGETATASVGQTLLEKGENFFVEKSSDRLTATSDRNQGGYKVSANEQYPLKARDNNDGGFYMGGADRKDVAVKIDEQGRLLSPHVYFLRAGQWQENTIFKVGDTGEKLFEAVQTEKLLAPQSHRQELVFLGVSDENIKLQFSEYKGAAAKPHKSQELVYSVAKHDIIRFRNYRIQIKSASDQRIEYTVLTD